MSLRLREIYTSDAIQARVRELAAEISAAYRGERLVAICVLKGAVHFFSDLTRQLACETELEFVRLSSYGKGVSSCGEVSLLQDLGCDVRGRHVLVVEDIVDTGRSLQCLLTGLRARCPASLRACALVDKVERREVEISIEYAGFRVAEGFLVGYGMDYAEKYRNLDALCVLEFTNEASD